MPLSRRRYIPPTGSREERAERVDRVLGRRRLVATMMLRHDTQRRMAEELNVSLSTINADVQAIRGEWREAYAADYQEHVSEHLAMLRELEKRVVTEAFLPGPRGNVRLWTIDRALQIRDRIAKTLGLEQPSKVEVAVKVEQVSLAIRLTLQELGLDPEDAAPIVGRNLRQLLAGDLLPDGGGRS